MSIKKLDLIRNNVTDDDIKFIRGETGVGKEKALKMLFACDYDVCNTIVALNAIASQLHPESIRDFYDKSGLNNSRVQFSQRLSSRSLNSSECVLVNNENIEFGEGSSVPKLDKKVVEVLRTAKQRRSSLQLDAKSRQLPIPSTDPVGSSLIKYSSSGGITENRGCRKRTEPKTAIKTISLEHEDKEDGFPTKKKKRLSFYEECMVFSTESSSDNPIVLLNLISASTMESNDQLPLRKRRSSLGKPIQRMEKLGIEDPERELYPEE